MQTLLQDLRYALRLLLKERRFTIFTLLTLAIGIGVITATFSVVNAVLLRPLPYEKPDEIVIVWAALKSAGVSKAPASGPAFVELQKRSSLFQDFGGIWVGTSSLTGDSEPEQIKIGHVSANFFSVLGAAPALGRTFVAQEQGAGTAPVIMLSDGVWRRRYGSDPNIIGRSIQMEGTSYTVVGVMPRSFQIIFPSEGTIPSDIQAWIPFPYNIAERPRAVAFIRIVGRLKQGVTIQQAQAQLDDIGTQLRSEFKEFAGQDLYLQALPLKQDAVKDARPALLALFAAAGLVLLIAGVNVASLLLTRANDRTREITMRTSLGASRSRIVRQLLTESLLLALLGGVAGVAFAWVLLNWLLSVWPDAAPRINTAQLDPVSFAFAFALSLLAGVVFGLAPAFSLSKVNLADSLKESARTKGSRRRIFRKVLVLCEVTLACVLLIGAGLMLRTFVKVLQVDPGFNPAQVLTFKITLPNVRYPKDETRVNLIRQLENDLSALPGVQSVGAISHIPFDDFPNWQAAYWAEGTPEDKQGTMLADHRSISSTFFRSLSIPLVAGREFNEHDDSQHPPVTIIDEALAQKVWPNADPLGQKLSVTTSVNGAFKRDWAQVVGVVKHIKYATLVDEGRPQVYLTYLQSPPPRFQVVYTMRIAGTAESLVGPIRQAVAKLDKDLPISKVQMLDQYVAQARVKTRLTTLLSSMLAATALILACIGIYGVTSYSVTQRTSEIGVRMAMGAEPRQIIRLFLRENLIFVIAGILVGVALSFGLAPLLSSLLFEIKPIDLPTFAAVSTLLFVVALLGCYFPARRASNMNPTVALRNE